MRSLFVENLVPLQPPAALTLWQWSSIVARQLGCAANSCGCRLVNLLEKTSND